MKFSKELLAQYRELMQTTNLQKCYQEVINLLKALHITLKKEMTDFTFTGRITENQMDFSYFQATTQELKKLGLKIQIVFLHSSCRLEVWVSGYNRKIQCAYYERLRSFPCPYTKCENPERQDYIVKIPIEKSVETDDFACILQEIKKNMKEAEMFFEEMEKK